MKKTSSGILIFFCLLIIYSCKQPPFKEKKQYDLAQIKEKGELNVITMNSSTSYFIYKDEPMGYDYELCKNFCDQHGLKLNIKVAENPTKLLEMLKQGEGDLVAYCLPVTNEQKDSIIYCGLEEITHQVLVQTSNKGDTLVNDVTQLLGKKVSVKKNTRYDTRLRNLDAELGGGIKINDILKDTITEEDIIKMVASEEIRYTISDEILAKLNKTYYKNINISLVISGDQRLRWSVRNDTPDLAKALDEWFEQNDKTPSYTAITKKYFELSKDEVEDSPLADSLVVTHTPKGGISPYDTLFIKYAKTANLDWKLLAAIGYHESRFRNDVSSWAGAVGVMGLMPRTAVAMGIKAEDRTNPDLNIKAATKLFVTLEKMFANITNKDERMKIVLAAYNGGNGHVTDAQALARKYGDNPNVWEEGVKKYIELKRNPEYYNDPVCKNGYFRGTETIAYVDKVISKWNNYKGSKEK